MLKTPLTGVLPVAPTPFLANGDVDSDGMKRILDCMVDQGADAICILANFSEQFLLTDEERAHLTSLTLEHVAGRVPVIVTISHFATRIVRARALEAKAKGAAMLMVMPPYHGAGLRASEKGMIEHFAAIAEAGLPIMFQDAPLSGVQLSASQLVNLAEKVPLVSYLKIEMPQSAQKLRDIIALGGTKIIGPCDGEESITLMADLDAGATGSMCSALLPDLIRPIIMAHRAGNRTEAARLYARVLPLINFENRQCGLRAAKTVLMEGGVIGSDNVRHPLEPLHPATKAGLLELAREVNPLALSWGK